MARSIFDEHDRKPPAPPAQRRPRPDFSPSPGAPDVDPEDEMPVVKAPKVEETSWADHPHNYPPPVVKDAPVVAPRTTDPEDIQLLADEVVALCKTSAYDDMTWAEIDNALMLASHKIKLVFVEHGTLDPA